MKSCLRKLSGDSYNSNKSSQKISNQQSQQHSLIMEPKNKIEFLQNPCHDTIKIQEEMLNKLENSQKMNFVNLCTNQSFAQQKSNLIKQLVLHQKSQYIKPQETEQKNYNIPTPLAHLLGMLSGENRTPPRNSDINSDSDVFEDIENEDDDYEDNDDEDEENFEDFQENEESRNSLNQDESQTNTENMQQQQLQQQQRQQQNDNIDQEDNDNIQND